MNRCFITRDFVKYWATVFDVALGAISTIAVAIFTLDQLLKAGT